MLPSFLHHPHSSLFFLIISPMGNLALSDSFFLVPYLLLSSWWRFRSWMQRAVHLHRLHFIFSILYGVIWRSWCNRSLSRISMRIPNHHFSTWKITTPTFPTVPHLFPNPEHVQPRIDRASDLEISCLFCTMAYVFHTHQHMKLLIFWPRRIRSLAVF